MSPHSGFTLLEILLVVTMVTIVAGSGLFVFMNLVAVDVSDTSARMLVEGMRRARWSAAHMRLDDAWGVFVSSRSATVFRGDNVLGRDESYDEEFVFPDAVSPGGTTAVVFRKGTGSPVAAATISLVFQDAVRTVSVNAAGAISYDP